MQRKSFVKVGTKVAATTVFSVTLLASSSAFASATSIGRQLIGAAIAAGFLNRTPTHDPYINTLRNQGSHLINVNLRSGVAYNLLGVCDEYCADVDLKLYDGNYNLIDSDTRSGDVPVISVIPSRSGRFYVEVDMADCNANYCYYGVGVFGR